VGAEFLRHYLEAIRGAACIPANRGDLALLLRVYLLEKVIYELGYELNNRPKWVSIPLRGIVDLLGAAPVQGERS
jgi:predicted trehalose synthase